VRDDGRHPDQVLRAALEYALGSILMGGPDSLRTVTARTHGTGRFLLDDLGALGSGCVLEEGVLVFNAAHVFLGDDVYVGHRAMLKGDTRGELRIAAGSWIGQDCYLQSAGGIRIGERAGIGPRVMILTSTHEETPPPAAIIDAPLILAPVEVGAGCDIGVGAILLPGARIGDGAQVGAGAVVMGEVPPGTVAAGVPARVLRRRGERA
jgi:acetyltransferase-like isoleucine patch superfamily enzyme